MLYADDSVKSIRLMNTLDFWSFICNTIVTSHSRHNNVCASFVLSYILIRKIRGGGGLIV